jgi:hypothetical protein
MSLPEFRKVGWLPAGHWTASWEEVEARFGGSPGSRREALLAKLVAWRRELCSNGVSALLIMDGSFVSTKENPGDCDCLLIYDDTNGRLGEDPDSKHLVDYVTLKEQGLGDVFVFPVSLTIKYPSLFHKDAFDFDKSTHLPKGVVEVEI